MGEKTCQKEPWVRLRKESSGDGLHHLLTQFRFSSERDLNCWAPGMPRAVMDQVEKRLVFSTEAIASQVQRLAQEISRDYQGGDLLLLGVLKGAFVFLADLVRHLTIPVSVDFVRLSSYGGGTTSSGKVRITHDVDLSLYQHDVLIVEDIVDSGLTLSFLREHLLTHKPRSLKICALVDKRERRSTEVPLDYVGFHLHKGFLIGYGLDCNDAYRQLPEIYELIL
jgi:hypoxanthine phosphoribosyltransferase